MEDRPILVIEDDVDDMQLIVRALKHSLSNEIIVTRDAKQALDYLVGGTTISGSGVTAKPALIFLDLKLPQRSGFDVLADIRMNPATHYIPVVVLSSSDALEDMQKAYDLGANSYVRKPVSFGEFAEALRQVAAYWLFRNSAPGAPPG